jgi:predicted ATPase/DNA-binding SARP family transcriptional activator
LNSYLRFRVLGPLEVMVGAQVVPVRGPRIATILAVLLADAGRAISRDRLIDEVWGDEPPPTAVAALQVHVSSLRKLVGPCLRSQATGYALELTPDQLDASRFEGLVREAHEAADADSRSRLLRSALAMWRGEAFAAVAPTPTVAAAAVRLAELRLIALEDRVEADLALGRHQELTAELQELSLANPHRERLAGQLMLALHRSGRGADALTAFERTSRSLRGELGVGPGADLVALEQAIRRDDPTLAAPPPVALPTPPGRFVGRERELAEVAQLLGRTSLLTLVGAGGCGKTRLAMELARRELPAHPDGAQMVDMAQVEPARFAGAVADAVLGAPEPLGARPEAALVTHFRDRRVLLVLDGCERVAEPCGELVRRLLESCSGLRVLVTSRQALGLPGEVVWRVPGLDAPDAVDLLADRAAAALPGRGLPAEDRGEAGLAARVCRRLDGLPLAIELVAARLDTASLFDIAANLDRKLSLLTTTGPGRPPRHRTMRAAIEWSHALLDTQERALFRRLSVFAGSFDLAAAEVVGADPEGESPRRQAEVMPVLFRLVDKSMVGAVSAFAGATRYRLLDTMKEFAAEQMDGSAEAGPAWGRLAGWYLKLARSAPLPGTVQGEPWALRLAAEMSSMRGVLEWCLGVGRAPEQAMAIVAPLWPYLWALGASDEGRRWLLRCLAAGSTDPTAERGLALRAAAHLTRNIGDADDARRLGEECLGVYQALGDQDGTASACNGLGMTAYARGDYAGAVSWFREGLDLLERSSNEIARAATLTNLGAALRGAGDLDEAGRLLQAGLATARTAGDRGVEGLALSNLSMLAIRRGDLEQARQRARESLAVYSDLRFAEGQLNALETLACIDAADGHAAKALRMLTVVGRERRHLGAAVPTAARRQLHDAAMESIRATLSDPDQAEAAATARLTGLRELAAERLTGL